MNVKEEEANRNLRFKKFLKKARKKFGNKFDYDPDTYINSGIKMTIIDSRTGIKYQITPKNHLRTDSGIPQEFIKRKTIPIEVWKSKVDEFFEEGSITILSDYNGYKNPIEVRCNKHEKTISIRAKRLTQGCNGCPDCYKEKLSASSAKKKYEWTQEDLDIIQKYLDEGKSLEEIGSLLNITGHQIGVVVKKFGLKRRILWKEERELIKSRCEEGKTIEEIAEELGLSPKTVLIKTCSLNIPHETNHTLDIKKKKNFLEDDVINLIKSGKTLENIANDLNTTLPILIKFIRDHNIYYRDISREERENKLKSLSKYSGKSYVDITLETGYDYKFIKEAVNKGYLTVSLDTISSGEKLVSKYLTSKSINYIPQYFCNIENRKHLVDFYLEMNGKIYWIEYNGKQHYVPTKIFQKTEEDFEEQLRRDERIRKYCCSNNIQLIEIPYIFSTLEKISEFLDKVIIEGIDPNTLIDYNSLYKHAL